MAQVDRSLNFNDLWSRLDYWKKLNLSIVSNSKYINQSLLRTVYVDITSFIPLPCYSIILASFSYVYEYCTNTVPPRLSPQAQRRDDRRRNVQVWNW